jgi:hypothetical protein
MPVPSPAFVAPRLARIGALFLAGLLPLLLAIAQPAMAAPADARPRAGTYERSSGVLTVIKEPGGAHRFRIFTRGGNSHVCELSGSLVGPIGRTEDEGLDACVVTLTAKGSSVNVSIVSVRVNTVPPRSCPQYCGMLASFDGTYLMPAPACRMAAREATRERFIAAYRAKRYVVAEATLDRMYRDCGELLWWMEKDEVRSDLAIVRHHLGRDAACLAILVQTLAADVSDRDELRDLPHFRHRGHDFDNYLPVARAIWRNRALCGGRPYNEDEEDEEEEEQKRG